MFRLFKADLHGVMDQMEDKGLLLKQYLREMESTLQQKQARQSQLSQTCRQLQRELSQQHQEEERLETETALAIRKDKDDIAKILIRKRRTLQACCKGMTRRLEILEEEGMHLARMVDQQQLQYQELKVRAAEYCHRVDRNPFEEAAEIMAESGFSAPLTEEEIELELLQRKEALKQGGGQ
jgi:phage shock protein A